MNNEVTINDGSDLLDYLTGSAYPDFFFGRLVLNNNDDKFCVREIVSCGEWGDCIELPDKSGSLYEDNIDSMVVGCARKNGTTKLFIDNELEVPVQIIPWAYVRQSNNGTVNAVEFFRNHEEVAREPLICDTVPLIGGGRGEKKGHIIIFDVIEEKDGNRKQGYFLKGFLSIGCYRIQYSDVRVWSNGDFHDVASFNQTFALTYKDQIFLMMVPKRNNNEYKNRKLHSVLDYEGISELGKCEWKPLSSLPSLSETRYFVDGSSTGEKGTVDSRELSIRGAVVVKEFAHELGIRPNRLLADLMDLKILASVNQRIEPDVAIKVAQKYGYSLKVEYKRDATNKKPVRKSIIAGDKILQDKPENVQARPPLVTFPGHLDHSRSATIQDVDDDVHDETTTSARETVDDPTTLTDNPTYSFGPNVGGEIEAAVEAASGTGKVETEVEFLERFIWAVKQCGFYYKPQDLIRFHTCVKCGFLTVLGGAPGSGKSSLVKLYASAILGREGGKCRDGMLMVDVNSSWAEPADIFGYWNMQGEYRSASTGVVPFLREAQNHKHLNLICLEEMNLARVEHYFSDFMQLSEREIAERELKGVPFNSDDKDQENARLSVDESVRIVGTNNFDQTTQCFSARFFDRCNYVELQDSRHDEDFLFSRPNIDQGDFNYMVSWDTYGSWINTSRKLKIVKDDNGVVIGVEDENGKEILGKDSVKRFKKIRNALKGLNLKPSPRVESSLVEYVVNRPFLDEFEKDCTSDKDRQLRKLDEFVAQRILPRYTPNYLIDDSAERDALETELKCMTLSLKILNEKKSELDGKPHA